MSSRLVYHFRKVAIPFISILIFVQDLLILLLVQLLSKIVLPVSITTLQRILDCSKRSFIDILTTILETIAPSRVRITTDNATIPKDTFRVDPKGDKISSNLEQYSISISNHQIYTDWIYLWWVAYTSKMGGRVYIMLKKSLQSIPILGYGMTNFKFIFMNRKWAKDRITLSNQLGELDADARGQGPLHGKGPVLIDEEGQMQWATLVNEKKENWPYNLILFPEGTNFTANTKMKSQNYGAKVGKETFNYVLLPHVTGLRHCIKVLKPSLNILYDVTIGYSGVNADEYAESLFGLKSIFLESIYPKLVDIHVRGFKIDDIPIDNEEEFDQWLHQVWKEKDDLLARYYKEGTFYFDNDLQHSVTGNFCINKWELFLALACPILTGLLSLKFILSFFF